MQWSVGARYQQESTPEPFSHPGPLPSLDPLDRMGDFPRAPASQAQLRARKSLSYSCCGREQPSHLKPSIPRTGARAPTGCLPPTSAAYLFGTLRLPLVHVGDCRGRSSQLSAIRPRNRHSCEQPRCTKSKHSLRERTGCLACQGLR
jgi:hypothetical protein